MSDRDTEFAEYFAARADAMRGTAFLLCGDWHRAEDLVQQMFTKLYLVWNRVSRHEVLDAYARKILFRLFVSERRRGWLRFERVSAVIAEPPPTGSGSVEDRLLLLDALAMVPPRQRAVLVLRYWEDQSVEETARLLGCTAGTVKSQAARGLRALRELVGDTSLLADRGERTL